MSYTITNSDGSTLVILGDRKIDQSTTSLTLVGKNWSGYGEYINNNFVKLLSSNASSSSSPPRSPLKGQLWYDTTAKRLKVYDDTFKPVTGAIVAASRPTGMTTGDIWFDTQKQQMFVYSDGAPYLIGPLFPFPNQLGIGFVEPTPVIKDIEGTVKDVSILKNYGQVVGFVANEQFLIDNTNTNYSYITATTTSTVKGLSILGDIYYSGKISNKYLSLEVDFSHIFNPSIDNNGNVTNDSAKFIQNSVIQRLLNCTYPVNTGVSTIQNPRNSNSIETGVPVGSEARVLVKYVQPTNGYQVRRYVATKDGWNFLQVNPGPFTITSNVVDSLNRGDIV